MASLRRKLRSPFWFACYTDADGARTQRSTKQSDRKRAQAIANAWEKAAKLASERRLGEAQARKVLSDIYEVTSGEALASATARDFLSKWPERKKDSISHRTWQAYTQVARDFIESLGVRADRDISQISRFDVVKYRDKVAAATTSANANKLLKYLRVGLGLAWKEGLAQDNPAAKVDRLARRDGEGVDRRPFTLPELRTILKHANTEWKGIILFGFYTGQRLADIGSLLWSNLDTEHGVIRLVTSKRGRRMEIPIAATLMEHIQSMAAPDEPDAPLFPKAYPIATSEKGDSRLSHQFYEVLVAASLAKPRTKEATGMGRSRRRTPNEITFHSLRHTATSLLKNAGVSEAIAMDIIGHDSKAISRHYTHIDDNAKRKALGKLPKLL